MPSAVVVRTDGQFRLYAGSEEKPQRILGPSKSTARLFAMNLEAGGLHLEVDEDTLWSVEIAEIPPAAETPDPIPMEIPVEFEGRELRDEVMDYVREVLSRQVADDGFETLEEANDFEMDDDEDPLIASPYEYEELDSDNSLENRDLEADNKDSSEQEHHNERDEKSQPEASEATRDPGSDLFGARADDKEPSGASQDVDRPTEGRLGRERPAP